jgi:hypothetical protein
MILTKTRLVSLAVMSAFVVQAEVTIPEGTRIRVRLETTISSGTAEEGQTVELTVADPVRIGDTTIFEEGARVTGTITEAHEKRRMGRAGKLDFSIDRAKAADNQWVPLRYTVTKKSGENHSLRTGVITAGVAFVFWPAAPVMLLMKGKDITINKGISFDVYTDANRVAWVGGPPSQSTLVAAATAFPQQVNAPGSAALPAGTATITVTSTEAVADIEVDGSFVGSTPTTLQLSSGSHRVSVKGNEKIWERTVQVTAGSTISLTAVLK